MKELDKIEQLANDIIKYANENNYCECIKEEAGLIKFFVDQAREKVEDIQHML